MNRESIKALFDARDEVTKSAKKMIEERNAAVEEVFEAALDKIRDKLDIKKLIISKCFKYIFFKYGIMTRSTEGTIEEYVRGISHYYNKEYGENREILYKEIGRQVAEILEGDGELREILSLLCSRYRNEK